jgi:hypothetical protein
VCGADARIGCFDVTRVFEGYQLTKDLNREAMASINQTGPQTDPDRRDLRLREKLERHVAEFTARSNDKYPLGEQKGVRFQFEVETVKAQIQLHDARRALAGRAGEEVTEVELQKQISDLDSKSKQAAFGSAESGRIAFELQIARDRLKMHNAWSAMEGMERDLAMRDESRIRRFRILNDIWAMAAKLRAERGFTLLVPVDGPDEDQFLTIIVPADCEDVTDALLKRLNREYGGKKEKQNK